MWVWVCIMAYVSSREVLSAWFVCLCGCLCVCVTWNNALPFYCLQQCFRTKIEKRTKWSTTTIKQGNSKSQSDKLSWSTIAVVLWKPLNCQAIGLSNLKGCWWKNKVKVNNWVIERIKSFSSHWLTTLWRYNMNYNQTQQPIINGSIEVRIKQTLAL